MTFEEFFKKKKISLDALQQAEPGLFSEFKNHFEQMGEKSFDHTKKYWFNKLRGLYPAPVEQKIEKVKIDNPLAEQTITDSLEQAATPAKTGFTPRFKAAASKPAEELPVEHKPAIAESTLNTTAPKPGFTPRFKATNLPKPAEEKLSGESVPEKPETNSASSAPKPGFTPRFKAANIAKPPASPEEEKPVEGFAEEKPLEETTAPQSTAPKPGFTPRFKAANMPKPVEKPVEESPAETPAPSVETPTPTDTPKPAYKPRFNPKNLPKKEE